MKTTLENVLLRNQPKFHGIVDFNPETEKITPLNLSKTNIDLSEDIFSSTELFSNYIDKLRKTATAKFLIGGYAEDREMYKRSALFSFEKQNLNKQVENVVVTNAEPRRLHLGIDIWGDAGTKIYAPLGGMVHSFANNNNFGDYGATIILQHQLNTVTFYTLYGHLSLNDIANLKVGHFFTRGQCFAHFGNPFENGNWPPHLHFQIIEDIAFKEGDYPGVCKLSEKKKFLSNCPDPDLILNMLQYTKP
jgi:peptidoglycan LD-endopeptidase LytH